MAKKKAAAKTARPKKSATTAAKRVASRTKRVKATKKKAAVRKSAAAKKAPKKKSARVAAGDKTAPRKTVSLGRPRVTGEAKLDHFFQRDYQARELFAFLHVKTVKELEEFSPAEIVERLTAPVVQTVDRIRKALALNNRCLSDDREFALQFQQELAEQMRR